MLFDLNNSSMVCSTIGRNRFLDLIDQNLAISRQTKGSVFTGLSFLSFIPNETTCCAVLFFVCLCISKTAGYSLGCLRYILRNLHDESRGKRQRRIFRFEIRPIQCPIQSCPKQHASPSQCSKQPQIIGESQSI